MAFGVIRPLASQRAIVVCCRMTFDIPRRRAPSKLPEMLAREEILARRRLGGTIRIPNWVRRASILSCVNHATYRHATWVYFAL